MKPQHIQILVAIAEHGSLRAAAKSLNKSQPALTQTLKQAEQELAMALFSRTSSGIELTEMGKCVIGRASTITSEIARLQFDGVTYLGSNGNRVQNIVPGVVGTVRSVMPYNRRRRFIAVSMFTRRRVGEVVLAYSITT